MLYDLVFLLYNKVNQLYLYMYPLSLERPSFPISDVVTLAVTVTVLSHIHAEGWCKALRSFSKRKHGPSSMSGETSVSPKGSIFGGKYIVVAPSTSV